MVWPLLAAGQPGQTLMAADGRIPVVASAAVSGGTVLADLTAEERFNMTELTLSGTVTEEDFKIIRDDMLSLTKIDLSATDLTALPDRAFAGMNALAQVVLPATCTRIGKAAFMTCPKLTAVTLPTAVTEIGELAFARSGLQSITIGSAVTSLGDNALFGCADLHTIMVSGGNTAYRLIDGALYTADRTQLIKCPPAKKGSITLPKELKTIAPAACADCVNLALPAFPDGLTTIGDYAFANCPAMAGELVLPASVTTIGAGAFYGDSGLTGTLALPAALTGNGYGAFAYTSSVTAVSLPATYETMAPSTFECCSGVATISSAAATPPAVGAFALRNVERSTTFIDVDEAHVTGYRQAPVWSEFSNYDAPFEGYDMFHADGQYRIKYVGAGEANGKYVTFVGTPYGAPAALQADRDAASVWELEFFTTTEAALPFCGEPGSDIRYISGDRCMHINMAGQCYDDPLAGYGTKANRTFAFYMRKNAAYDAAEGPLVAIVGNGTLWGSNNAGTQIITETHTAKAPPVESLVFRLEPLVPTAVGSVVADSGNGEAGGGLYDLRGVKVNVAGNSRPAPGLYIKVCPDGSSRKVYF